MVGVLWAYEGWHYVTFSAGEVLEPQRNFARGIIVGTAALVGIYVLANIAYIAALGPMRSAESTRIAADVAAVVLGPRAGKLIAVAILISIFSAANATVLTASRVYFAMARDGVFFQRMGEINPRWNTPAFAIVASCIWAAVIAATGTFDELLTYVIFTGWGFYAARCCFHLLLSPPGTRHRPSISHAGVSIDTAPLHSRRSNDCGQYCLAKSPPSTRRSRSGTAGRACFLVLAHEESFQRLIWKPIPSQI